MTVIQSASRYAYTPAFRSRPSISDDAAEFSPNRLDRTDPDGGNAGNAVKPQVIRRSDDTADSRFEFALSYRSAFFHASNEDSGGGAARDGSPATGYAAESPADMEAESDGLPESPIDLLASLLGGISGG